MVNGCSNWRNRTLCRRSPFDHRRIRQTSCPCPSASNQGQRRHASGTGPGHYPQLAAAGHWYRYESSISRVDSRAARRFRSCLKPTTVLFVRSSYASGQRCPVHWGGDCWSTFESMAESLRGGRRLASAASVSGVTTSAASRAQRPLTFTSAGPHSACSPRTAVCTAVRATAFRGGV